MAYLNQWQPASRENWLPIKRICSGRGRSPICISISVGITFQRKSTTLSIRLGGPAGTARRDGDRHNGAQIHLFGSRSALI
eukprot:1426744-Pleurochrysis_carterae.AAC.8